MDPYKIAALFEEFPFLRSHCPVDSLCLSFKISRMDAGLLTRVPRLSVKVDGPFEDPLCFYEERFLLFNAKGRLLREVEQSGKIDPRQRWWHYFTCRDYDRSSGQTFGDCLESLGTGAGEVEFLVLFNIIRGDATFYIGVCKKPTGIKDLGLWLRSQRQRVREEIRQEVAN